MTYSKHRCGILSVSAKVIHVYWDKIYLRANLQFLLGLFVIIIVCQCEDLCMFCNFHLVVMNFTNLLTSNIHSSFYNKIGSFGCIYY